MTSGQPGIQPNLRPNGALRLIFEYEGSEIRLVSRQSVDMVVPPSDQVEILEPQSGFWIEVRDAADATLHRRVLHNPVRQDAEVFSNDPDQSLARLPVDQPRGTFAVLVPNIAGSDHVALVSSPLGVRSSVAPATEIARFPL